MRPELVPELDLGSEGALPARPAGESRAGESVHPPGFTQLSSGTTCAHAVQVISLGLSKLVSSLWVLTGQRQAPQHLRVPAPSVDPVVRVMGRGGEEPFSAHAGGAGPGVRRPLLQERSWHSRKRLKDYRCYISSQHHLRWCFLQTETFPMAHHLLNWMFCFPKT